jgi:hypothetical protein
MSTPQEESGQVKLKELSPEERERLLAISREKMEWDNAARLLGARQEGEQIGVRKGRKEGEKKSAARCGSEAHAERAEY